MTDPKQPNAFNPNAVGSFPVYVPVRTMQPKGETSHPSELSAPLYDENRSAAGEGEL